MTAPAANAAEIQRTLEILGSEVVELRILGPGGVTSGYFDRAHHADLVLAATRPQRAGVYVTPNPVNPALLSRAHNRVIERPKSTTADADIVRRRWLPIDLDPKRPANISSTDVEHAAALNLAEVIMAALRAEGWPEPAIAADSGNGAHLIYRIDLANDEAARDLVRRVLEALDLRFSDSVVQVDVTTFNAARIFKLYGTRSCKGDDTADRPHRQSRIVSNVASPEPVARDLLEKLAASAPRPDAATKVRGRFDLQAWINRHSVPVSEPSTWNGGTKWVFDVCPFNPEHTNRSAVLLQLPSGALDFKCHHNGCTDKGWADLRKLYEPDRAAPADDGSKRGNQATALVKLALAACQFFHDGDIGYAVFMVGNHEETHELGSKTFKYFLISLYLREKGLAVPSADNLKAALNVLEAQARLYGAQEQVHLRVARYEGAVYIDTGDAEWRVIEVDVDGWRVIPAAAAPVRFRRTKGTMPLPLPVKGEVKTLRQFVNLAEDDEAGFILLVCYVIAALMGVGPFPILLLIAEQGAAKSTLLRVLRRLLDPNALPIRALPKEPRDFAIACENNWLVFFDNVSRLPQWLSDLMCSAATGGGFGVREHYEGRTEEIFDYTRPQGFSAIRECANSPDIQDRGVALNLPAIPRGKRRTEKEFWSAFNDAAPGILGALLDGVSCALRNIDRVEIDELPRMADFAQLAIAALPALGWKAEQFLAAYCANGEAANAGILEASPIAALLPGLASEGWQGTAAELLERLNGTAPEQLRKRRDWPTSPRLLSNDLRSIATNLRTAGVEITFEKPSHSRRLITISQVEIEV